MHRALSVLCFAWMFAACASEGANPQDAVVPDAGGPPAGGPRYAFICTVTGKLQVVDLQALSVISTVQLTYGSVHGVGVTKDRHVVYAPNPSFTRVDKLQFSEDMATAAVAKSFELKQAPQFGRMSPDARVMVTGSALPSMYPQTAAKGTNAAFIRLDTDEIAAELTFDSPAHALFDPMSTKAYVLQQDTADVPVVDLGTFQVVATLIDEGHAKDKVAPGHGAVRTQDGLLCIAEFTGNKVNCLDPNDASKPQRAIEIAGELPHDLSFEPDGKRLWIGTTTGLPVPVSESTNPDIPAFLHVYDIDAGVEVDKVSWKYAMWHVHVAPNGRAYASGSWGTLVVFDVATRELVGELKVNAGPQPLMTVDF